MLAQEDSRIVFVETAHAGVSSARNTAMGLATGKYLFFLDSDDVIHPRLLETLISGMEKHDAPISGTQVISVSNKNLHKLADRIKEEDVPGEVTFQSHNESLYSIFMSSSPIGMIGGVMMLRDWVGDTEFCTDFHIGEDFYFIYQNLIKGASTVFLKQKWYFARSHSDNLSRDYGYSGFLSRYRRRELVWISEERFGRTDYVLAQKADALGVYFRVLQRAKLSSDDFRKIQSFMKFQRQNLLTGMPHKQQNVYYLGVYFPAAYLQLRKIINLFHVKGKKYDF